MSLLFITQNYYPNKGGMAESCDRLVRNFRKKNIPVHVIHFTNRKPKFLIESQINGSYSAVPIHNSDEYTLNLAVRYIQQLNFLKNIKYIVAFGGYLPILMSPILAKWVDKKLVTLIRGNDFDEAIFSKRREALFYALKNSTYIFTVTRDKKEKIISLLNHKNTYYTHNGIDSSLWKTTKSQWLQIDQLKELSHGKKRIVIIGQLKAKKGILEFSETFSKFNKKNEYEVWMIGDVDPLMKIDIEKLEINVRFFPFVNKHKLIPFYYAADIVLIPSFYDGMPNTLLEAAATKNLVIASNVDGIKDVIENKKDGFLFNPLKPSSLLEVLIKVHKLNKKEKEDVALQLHKKILENFTEEKEIINYLNILQP